MRTEPIEVGHDAPPRRAVKTSTLHDAIASIAPGSTIALGGNVNNNVAMAGVRELVRQGIGDLTLLAFAQGIGADTLVGAGCVRTIHTNYTGMEHLGLAPAFRAAGEDGTTAIVDWDSLGMIQALSAAASGSPFAVVPRGIEVTSWPTLSPQIYRGIVDPFSGESVYAVPPLQADVAVLYASRCDEYGNAQHRGFVFWDELIAQAADRVIVVCEEIVPNETIRASSELTALPGYLVSHVVESAHAAYPAGAPPLYESSAAHLERYVQRCRTEQGRASYIAQIRHSDEVAYLADRWEEDR